MAKSFKEAFAAARKAGKSTFTWNGGSYNTKTKDETPGAKAPARRPAAPATSTRPNTRSKQEARPQTAATRASNGSAPSGASTARSTPAATTPASELTVAQKQAMIRSNGDRVPRNTSPGRRRQIDGKAREIARTNKGR